MAPVLQTEKPQVEKLPCERGFGSFLHKLAPKKHPLRPETEQAFVDLISRRLNAGMSVSIQVTPVSGIKSGSFTGSVGTIGDFEYTLICDALVDGKERIQFERNLFERFGSDAGIADSADRGRAALKSVLAAVLQAEVLQGKLPEAKVAAKSGRGNITPELRDQLDADVSTAEIDVDAVRALLTSS